MIMFFYVWIQFYTWPGDDSRPYQEFQLHFRVSTSLYLSITSHIFWLHSASYCILHSALGSICHTFSGSPAAVSASCQGSSPSLPVLTLHLKDVCNLPWESVSWLQPNAQSKTFNLCHMRCKGSNARLVQSSEKMLSCATCGSGKANPRLLCISLRAAAGGGFCCTAPVSVEVALKNARLAALSVVCLRKLGVWLIQQPC